MATTIDPVDPTVPIVPQPPITGINNPPFGTVTIAGTPTQGEILTASNTLSDADGLGAISYQWLRGGTPIPGATGATYTLIQADVGAAISVVASYTDGGGTLEQVTSAATAPIANVNDPPAGTVTIAGTPTQGEILTASNTLSDADGLGAISYQWLRGGTPIPGATGATYTLIQADVGAAISVVASYTDGGGTLEQVTSAATAPIANVNDPPADTVTIAGTPTQGEILTASNTLSDADGLGAINYQWLRGGTPIPGATGATYTLIQADVGAAVSVVASYTDGGGTVEQVTSAPTAQIANVNDPPAGAVMITGTPTQGEILTASNILSDADGLGAINYQWLRGGTPIPGATGATYTLIQADVGAEISVVASYTDGGGTVEQVTSAPTAQIANVNDPPAGAVMITGTPTQGEILTASNTLSDADGLGAIGYQWLRGGTPIPGATGTTYTLVQADVGAEISVVASYIDGGGTLEQVTSALTAVVDKANTPPMSLLPDEIFVLEGETAIIDVNATDDNDNEGDGLNYEITGGADAARFSINAQTGVLSFNEAPDFENPADVGGDNAYEVEVAVTDSGGLTEKKTLTVTVTDDETDNPPANVSVAMLFDLGRIKIMSFEYALEPDDGEDVTRWEIEFNTSEGAVLFAKETGYFSFTEFDWQTNTLSDNSRFFGPKLSPYDDIDGIVVVLGVNATPEDLALDFTPLDGTAADLF